jgi:hypothetical protein
VPRHLLGEWSRLAPQDFPPTLNDGNLLPRTLHRLRKERGDLP